MNESTLNSIRTGFQTAHNTLLSAQKFPVVGVFASVAQFFVSIAELITAAAIAPIPLRNKASLLSNTQEYCDRKHCQDRLAGEGIDALVISVINIAILGFPVAAYHYFCKPEEARASVVVPVTKREDKPSDNDVDVVDRLIPKEHEQAITEDFYGSFDKSFESPSQTPNPSRKEASASQRLNPPEQEAPKKSQYSLHPLEGNLVDGFVDTTALKLTPVFIPE